MKKSNKVFQSIYNKLLDKMKGVEFYFTSLLKTFWSKLMNVGMMFVTTLGMISLSVLNVSADIVGKANERSNSWITVIQGLAFPVAIIMLAIGIGWSMIGNKKIGLGIIIASAIAYFCMINIQDLALVVFPK